MRKVLTISLAILLAPLAPSGPAMAKKDPFPWLNRRPPSTPVYPEILVTPAQLAELMDDKKLRVVDVRPAERYARGHLPGALPLDLEGELAADLAESRPRRVAERLGGLGLSGKETILLYGDEQSYETLGQVFWALEWAGCEKLRILDGGIATWTRQGGALESAPAVLAARRFRRGEVDSMLVDYEWIEERYGETETCELVDLRDAGLWSRPDAPTGYAPGHVPHSLPYDFHDLLPGDGRWPKPAIARAEFSRLGPREKDFVDLEAVFVLYGEGPADPRPGLGYLLLRLMDLRARVYPGGWADWSSREELPRVRIIRAEELRGMIARENPELADSAAAGFALFDLRGHRDFRTRHLPGAVPLPAHTVSDSLELVFEEHWPELDRAGARLVFYCYGPECVRSRIGASKAGHMGFRELLIFRGGMAEWRAGGFPGFGALPEAATPDSRRH